MWCVEIHADDSLLLSYVWKNLGRRTLDEIVVDNRYASMISTIL